MTVVRCGAKKKQGKGKCGQTAGWGTDHPGTGRCKLHGGKSPSGRKAAQREEAEKAVVAYGLPRQVDPYTALEDELHRTYGHVAWLAAIVADMEEDDLHGPVGGGKDSIPEERPHVWLVLYHQERRHLNAIIKTCLVAGFEERRVKLAEQQGQVLADVIRGILTDLGVVDQPEVPGIVRRHLTLVAAPG